MLIMFCDQAVNEPPFLSPWVEKKWGIWEACFEMFTIEGKFGFFVLTCKMKNVGNLAFLLGNKRFFQLNLCDTHNSVCVELFFYCRLSIDSYISYFLLCLDLPLLFLLIFSRKSYCTPSDIFDLLLKRLISIHKIAINISCMQNCLTDFLWVSRYYPLGKFHSHVDCPNLPQHYKK